MTEKTYNLNIPRHKREEIAAYVIRDIRKGILIDFFMILASDICFLKACLVAIDLIVDYTQLTQLATAKKLVIFIAIAVALCNALNLVRNLKKHGTAKRYITDALAGVHPYDAKKPHDILSECITMFMRTTTATDVFMTIIDDPKKLHITEPCPTRPMLQVQYTLPGLTCPVSFAAHKDIFLALFKPNGDTLVY